MGALCVPLLAWLQCAFHGDGSFGLQFGSAVVGLSDLTSIHSAKMIDAALHTASQLQPTHCIRMQRPASIPAGCSLCLKWKLRRQRGGPNKGDSKHDRQLVAYGRVVEVEELHRHPQRPMSRHGGPERGR